MKRPRNGAVSGAGAIVAVGLLAAGCGQGGGGSASDRGPIKIWLSNDPNEVAWGDALVKSWNAAHPGERVTAQSIPAGKTSEEVISASITAGNAPCLIYNTAPAAVPGFARQAGLVPLEDFPGADQYVAARTGAARADQYRSADGKYFQMPWKANPVMIFYNKAVFAKAGIPTPKLTTYAEFMSAAETVKAKGGVQAAIWPAPSGEFSQPWFDFYPLFAAQSGGHQLVQDGRVQFNSQAGRDAAGFWAEIYRRGLAPKEPYKGDSFGDAKAAMAIVGPWAIKAYDKVKWAAVPIPTVQGLPPSQIHTFSDEKSIGLYFACKNRGTAWDFLKYTTSPQADGSLLDLTGQMPMRQHLLQAYPAFFSKNPRYRQFAGQAERTVEVPSVPNSVEIWQDFRNSWTSSVIFGKKPVDASLDRVATKIQSLATQKEG